MSRSQHEKADLVRQEKKCAENCLRRERPELSINQGEHKLGQLCMQVLPPLEH